MQKEYTTSFEAFESYDHLDETEKKLFDTAQKFRKIAYAPYSNFTVGCAILLEKNVLWSLHLKSIVHGMYAAGMWLPKPLDDPLLALK